MYGEKDVQSQTRISFAAWSRVRSVYDAACKEDLREVDGPGCRLSSSATTANGLMLMMIAQSTAT